jgi:outer membrane protein assembly factor BamB
LRKQKKQLWEQPSAESPYWKSHLQLKRAPNQITCLETISWRIVNVKRSKTKEPAVLSGHFAWTQRGSVYAEYAIGSGVGDRRNNGVVLAFTDEFGALLWSQTAEMEWSSEQPHLWKEWVIAGNCRGEIRAYRVTDGILAWRAHLQGCIRSFGHDASTLYVGVQEGTVYAYRPQR